MTHAEESSGFDLAGVFREARQAEPSAPESRQLPAAPIAGHVVEAILGRGGMGVVYRARDPLGRSVALKTLLAVDSPLLLERFQREGELASRLRHPGIVAVHSAGIHQGTPFLVQELVEGGRSFRAVLEASDRERQLALIRDVARALAVAHAEGIAHRDVKPSNILVDESGRPRVADFGLALARDLDRLTKSGSILGSPPYMSPEQVNGVTEKVGPATDVWSLGVILYEALTGRRPFLGESMANLFLKILRACPPTPRSLDPTISPTLEAIVLRALEPELERRYPHAGQVADDLEAVLAGEPPPWAPTAPPRRLDRVRRRWRHRDPALIRIVILGLLLSVPAVAGVTWLGLQAWRARVTSELEAAREARLSGLLRQALPWVIAEHDPLLPRAKLAWPAELQTLQGDAPAKVSSLDVAALLARAHEALRGGEATAPEPLPLADALARLADDPLLAGWEPDPRDAGRRQLATLAARLRAAVGVSDGPIEGAEGILLQALGALRWGADDVAPLGSAAVARGRSLLSRVRGTLPAAERLAARIDRLEAALEQAVKPVVRSFGRLPTQPFGPALAAAQQRDPELGQVAAGLFAARQLQDGTAALRRLVGATTMVRSWDADRYRELIAGLTELERLLGAGRLDASPETHQILRRAVQGVGTESDDAAWSGLQDLVVAAHTRRWVAPSASDLAQWRNQLLRYLLTGLHPQKPLPPLGVNRTLLRLGVLKTPPGLVRRYLQDGQFEAALAAPAGRHGDLYFLRATFRAEASRRPAKGVLAAIVADYAAALGDHLSRSERKALRLPPAVSLATPLTPRWVPIATGRLLGAHGILVVNQQLAFLPGSARATAEERVAVAKRIAGHYRILLAGGARIPRFRAARFAYEHSRLLRYLHETRRSMRAPPEELQELLEQWRSAAERSVALMRAFLDDLLTSKEQSADDVPALSKTVATKLVHSIEELAQQAAAAGAPARASAVYERELAAFRKRQLPTAKLRLWYLRSQLSMGRRAEAEQIGAELLSGLSNGTVQAEAGERPEIEAGVRSALEPPTRKR